jgi:hypothetical protein
MHVTPQMGLFRSFTPQDILARGSLPAIIDIRIAPLAPNCTNKLPTPETLAKGRALCDLCGNSANSAFQYLRPPQTARTNSQDRKRWPKGELSAGSLRSLRFSIHCTNKLTSLSSSPHSSCNTRTPRKAACTFAQSSACCKQDNTASALLPDPANPELTTRCP